MAASPGSAPLVTVVVPAYNAGRFVEEAVRSALRQTYADLEVVVVDDGSTDDTAERVRALCAADPRVRLLQQENGGVAAARNRGIAAARGALIAPLDADDVWYPAKLERQVEVMARDDTLGLVYTGWERVDEAGRPIPGTARAPRAEGWLADRLVLANLIPCASAPLIRRACLEEVGGYEDHRGFGGQGCEDWDLYLRLAERYRFAVVPECLVGYRQSGGSMSANRRRMRRSYEVVAARLRQRRPALPAALRRASRYRFYWYLSKVCRREGDRLSAWYWRARAVLVAPRAFRERLARLGPRRASGGTPLE